MGSSGWSVERGAPVPPRPGIRRTPSWHTSWPGWGKNDRPLLQVTAYTTKLAILITQLRPTLMLVSYWAGLDVSLQTLSLFISSRTPTLRKKEHVLTRTS